MQLITRCGWKFGAILLLTLAGHQALAERPVKPVANPCSRPDAGTVVRNPPALFSAGGVLAVRFSYQGRTDFAGRQLYCFMTPDGLENPTLHVKPGDNLVITITNNLPPGTGLMMVNAPTCGASTMDSSSVNIHYHGTNTSPTCHQDEVIRTTVNSGETFQYNVAFPSNEPPGLYWYHPHIHGIAEPALQGGASGAIVVEGIENVQPLVSGLPQRILMVRDQNVPGNPNPNGNVPSWDVSLNYVPITSPTNPVDTNFVPALLQMEEGRKEFFRVSNSCADTILDLQYVFDGQPQVLHVISIDGVAVNSQDGTQPGPTVAVTHFVMPPASRVEFIVSPPSSSVQLAQLITLGINTGPLGDDDPQRPLATIQLVNKAALLGTDGMMPVSNSITATQQRFRGITRAPIAEKRVLYFDENCAPTDTACSPNEFFMAVEGQPKHVFDPDLPPQIVATQGTVEQWTIQNRAGENHEFHLHQVHFLVQSQNNFELNGSTQFAGITGQFADMVQVPYWDANPKHPYPSVTILVDFRGPDVGDFVFHCHILGHEDSGMMNIIRVKPPGTAKVNRPGADPAAKASQDAFDIAGEVIEPNRTPALSGTAHGMQMMKKEMTGNTDPKVGAADEHR